MMMMVDVLLDVNEEALHQRQQELQLHRDQFVSSHRLVIVVSMKAIVEQRLKPLPRSQMRVDLVDSLRFLVEASFLCVSLSSLRSVFVRMMGILMMNRFFDDHQITSTYL